MVTKHQSPGEEGDVAVSDRDLVINLIEATSPEEEEAALIPLIKRIEPWLRQDLADLDPYARAIMAAEVVLLIRDKIRDGSYDLSKGQHPASFRAWIRTTTKNYAADYLRAVGADQRGVQRYAAAHPELVASPLPFRANRTVEEAVAALVLRREVLDALRTFLPEANYSVVYARYFLGLTLADIATELQLPLQTVYSRHDRAIKQLRADPSAREVLTTLLQHVGRGIEPEKQLRLGEIRPWREFPGPAAPTPSPQPAVSVRLAETQPGKRSRTTPDGSSTVTLRLRSSSVSADGFTPYQLAALISPYLLAIENLQHAIDKLRNAPPSNVTIHSISDGTP